MENKIEVSEELKELYRLIKKLDSNENNSAYHYLKYLVRKGGGRDYLYLTLRIFEDMKKDGYNFD